MNYQDERSHNVGKTPGAKKKQSQGIAVDDIGYSELTTIIGARRVPSKKQRAQPAKTAPAAFFKTTTQKTPLRGTVNPTAKRAGKTDADTYGPRDLCAWSVGGGEYRLQTNSPEIARKLAKRSKARLVAWGVNCFLRIYQEPMSRRQAIRLVDRCLVSANSGFFDPKRLPARRKSPRVSSQREVGQADE